MNTWAELLQSFKHQLGCSLADLAYVLEVSNPTMTSWAKGYDSKGVPSQPTYCYAAILMRMSKLSEHKLGLAYEKARNAPQMSDLRTELSGRNILYEDLVEVSALQTLLREIYS